VSTSTTNRLNTSEELLRSLSASDGSFLPTADVAGWLRDQRQQQQCSVRRIPLRELRGWRVDDATGDIQHVSGKFFRVRGLRAHSDFPELTTFVQPVIDQPEIGVLGIIAKVFRGVLYFLLQAKVEPGNMNLVQLSPTVQATRSNYTRVHGGARPGYLEYFQDPARGRVLFDQLHSEQGLFFLRKRNRNIIVLTTEDVRLQENYCWLTLGQVKELLKQDNVVNMDTRTVISAIPLVPSENAGVALPSSMVDTDSFGAALLASSMAASGLHTQQEIISWLTTIRATAETVAEPVPLRTLDGWVHDNLAIRRDDGRYFEINAVEVEAPNREVQEWTQPIVRPIERGITAFVTQQIDGILHFLLQARWESGVWSQIELAPTVQYLPGAVAAEDRQAPPFYDMVTEGGGGLVRHSSIQSEEGGRFLQYQNRNVIIEVPAGERIPVPAHFRWMTLGQVNAFIQYGGYVNIEARSLLATLGLFM
jgi:oxidase EvaA